MMTEYKLGQSVVNILGTDYNIFLKTTKEDASLNIYSGYCDKFEKKIVLRIFSEEEISKDNDYTENIEGMLNDTLIHELTHAFLYESGFNWTEISEEDICYWMSSNLLKLQKVYEKAKVIKYNKED